MEPQRIHPESPMLYRVFAVLLLFATAARAADPPSAAKSPPQQDNSPRLVILLVIDQFRADYLTRFTPHLAPDGFRRLLNDGASFENAYFSYAATVTAAGHATIASGRLPREHGIVANQWFDSPDAKKMSAAFTDPSCQPIGEAPGEKQKGRSPAEIIGPNFADQLKLADARSRVFSLAIKPRASIAMAGHKPDGCFWWSEETGRWLTSTYYTPALPACVEAINKAESVDRFAGKSWTRLLPDAAYALCTPLAPNTEVEFALSPAFPHPLPQRASKPKPGYYAALMATPFGNDITLDLAAALLQNEKLGQGPAIDLLCISLSSFDAAGHLFGPESPEMMDFTLQTDRQLAAFLNLVDNQVGPGRTLIALSADHGVRTIPTLAKAHNLAAGTLDLSALEKEVERAMQQCASSTTPYVRDIELPWLYLDPAIDALPPEKRRPLYDAAVAALRANPGIADAITADQLTGPPPTPDDPRYLAYRCYYPNRSGQICLRTAPYWTKQSKDAAGHSAGSNHDRHVPIVLYGPGIINGRHFTPADPLDIAPTLAAVLGIEPPLGCQGRVLHEALDTNAR